MSALSDSGLPPVQRVVTGHDDNGRARFVSEDVSPTKMIPSGDAAFLTIWATETVPADLNDERDGRDLPAGLTLERGPIRLSLIPRFMYMNPCTTHPASPPDHP